MHIRGAFWHVEPEEVLAATRSLNISSSIVGRMYAGLGITTKSIGFHHHIDFNFDYDFYDFNPF